MRNAPFGPVAEEPESWAARRARVVGRLRWLNAPLALGLAALLMLSGCSVDVIAPGQGAAPSATDTQPEVGEPTESEEPAESVEPTDSAEPTSSEPASDAPSVKKPTGPNAKAYRSYYLDDVDVTTGCPDGEIVIDESMRTTVITEDCDKVTVTAPFNNVLAQRVGKLVVTYTGSNSYFLVTELGSATIEAPFDHLYWDKGNPRVKVSGLNTVAKPNPVKE